MMALILIPAGILGLVLLLIIGEIKRAIEEHGIWLLVLRMLIGRHYSGTNYTNATFWRDSNGKVQGHPRYHLAKRHHRAGIKNLGRSLLYLCLVSLIGYGLIVDTTLTGVMTAAFLSGMLIWLIVRTVRKARSWHSNKTLVSPMAKGLAQITDQAESDVEKAITMKPNWQAIKAGEIANIRFPDSFLGSDGVTEAIEKYVERRFPKPVELSWKTTAPIYLYVKVDRPFPSKILFSHHLDIIEECRPGTYVGGFNKKGDPEILDHTKDFPMKGYCMNTGTGKTVRVLATAAQILGNDPYARLTGFDVKQVSLGPLKGIPGVTIYDDPFNMGEMWKGWYDIKEEMDRRYALKKAGTQTTFPHWWIFLEEGNTFAILIKGYYLNSLREKGQPAAPPIWYEAIAPILFQGREVGIFVNALLQNFMEKFFGNMSLRPAFSTIGMAGFKPSQYRTIVGNNSVPAIQRGQGRLLISEPDREVWVQGLYDDVDILMEYASRHRGKAEILP